MPGIAAAAWSSKVNAARAGRSAVGCLGGVFLVAFFLAAAWAVSPLKGGVTNEPPMTMAAIARLAPRLTIARRNGIDGLRTIPPRQSHNRRAHATPPRSGQGIQASRWQAVAAAEGCTG